jgi:hypothetical protein
MGDCLFKLVSVLKGNAQVIVNFVVNFWIKPVGLINV